MFRLTYISTARSPIEEEMLDSILIASRRNNARVDVTGLLVAGRNRFLQLLEGEEGAVRTRFERIAADPRHFACVVLRSGPADARLFPGWDMGSVRPGSRAGSREALAARRLIAQIDDPFIRAEFASFLDLHDRAA